MQIDWLSFFIGFGAFPFGILAFGIMAQVIVSIYEHTWGKALLLKRAGLPVLVAELDKVRKPQRNNLDIPLVNCYSA